MEQEKLKNEHEEVLLKESKLILYNDNFNTFDHVINSLMVVCKHDPIQAEQCALTVHYKGRCAVKSGSYEELLVMHTALSDRNLTVEINS